METKIGDSIRINTFRCHNYDVEEFNYSILFKQSELPKIVKILDIVKCEEGYDAYKVECNAGITYVRPECVEHLEYISEEVIDEDYSSLKKLLKECLK